MKIAFFGPETTYTHQAAIKHFEKNNEFVPKKTIGEVFESVDKNETEFGVVPVENSTEGSVAHTLDSFIESNLKIVAEIVLPIKHCLLSNSKFEEIKKIYSHQQPLGQCKKYLQLNFSDVERIESLSTASAAISASKEKYSAAIASELAGERFGLNILQKEINDEKDNQTRFFVIGKSNTKPTGKDKTTILFSTKNVPGALYSVLGVLTKHKINMTKIESRPSKKKTWEVVFFVEFEGHYLDKLISEGLKDIESNCVFFKVLGSYPAKISISD